MFYLFRLIIRLLRMVIGRSCHQINENEPIRLEIQKLREEHARKQRHDYSHVFRKKSRFDMIKLSCIIMGIELAYAAETAFVSPILLEIGIEHKHMTLVWGLSPLLGFFIAPFLGSLSDRCKLSLGRRRPYIILLSCGILIGLLLVPYGKEIGTFLGDSIVEIKDDAILLELKMLNISDGISYTIDINSDEYHYDKSDNSVDEVNLGTRKWAVLFTILGTILLDFDADTCQTPSRAYLLDVCVPEDHTKGLSTFTIMAGIGGFFGYSLGGINWEGTIIGTFFGGNIKTIFSIVTIIFVFCVFCTITSFREIPLSLIDKDELLRPVTQIDAKHAVEKNNLPVYIVKEINSNNVPSPYKNGNTNNFDLEKSIQSVQSSDKILQNISLFQYLKSIIFMPKSIRILCVTNLLCWMSHVCYCLYFTDFVGEAVFLGDPMAPVGSNKYLLYKEGVRFGCWGMAIYALTCVLYSMIIEYLIRLFKMKTVYVGGLLIFAIGMLILATYPSKILVLIFSTTAGIVYATLFTIPFLLVAQYHAKGSFKIKKGENVPIKQARGLGTDIAIISNMIFVAQLSISLSIGSLISWVGSTTAVIYVAGALSLCASISATKVIYMDI